MPEPAPTPLLDPSFLSRLERLEIVSRKILQGRTKGERLTKRRGQSAEFADFRPYVVGDDLRFLDWNLYARMDKLFLRVFLEEEDLHFYILVDNSLSMNYGSPTKLHFAKQVAAALGYIGLCNLDRVMIEPLNTDNARPSGVMRGRKNLPRMISYLENLDAVGGSDLTASLKSFSMRSKGKGVVIVLSDFMDKGGYEEGLKYLLARDMDVYAVQILSAEEIEPPLVGDLKLTDIEDGDEAEITMSAPLMRRYRETLAAWRGTLAQFCAKRGIACMFTSNQVPFDKLVLGYLRQRGLVR